MSAKAPNSLSTVTTQAGGVVIDFYQQDLAIARELGDRQGEGISLVNMGETLLALVQFPESLTHSQTALEIFQKIGNKPNEAEALKNLAEVHQSLGEMEMAQQYCQQAWR